MWLQIKVFKNLLNNKFNIINFSSKNNCDTFSHIQTASFYKTRNNEKISRYIRKTMATLNKDLKYKSMIFLCPHNVVDYIFIGTDSREKILRLPLNVLFYIKVIIEN